MKKEPFVTIRNKLEEIAKHRIRLRFYLYDEKGIRENVKALKGSIFLESGL